MTDFLGFLLFVATTVTFGMAMSRGPHHFHWDVAFDLTLMLGVAITRNWSTYVAVGAGFGFITSDLPDLLTARQTKVIINDGHTKITVSGWTDDEVERARRKWSALYGSPE